MPDPADATPPASQPAIPSMTIRADIAPETKKPAKLSYDDMVAKWTARGYPKAAAQGIADNMVRESGGDPTQIGDDGTSRGLFQEHAVRKAELEAYAKKQGKSADDPDLQIDFADQELKTKFPTLHAQLMKGDDRGDAEDRFKRVFERPASVMWANNPRLASDKYRFSDYALGEHDGRKNTNTVYMSPADYLDLSPDLDAQPFSNPSGRSLKASVDRGEPVESVPTMDMQVDGNTGTVTDQDGRHRALLAQQQGIDAIPVAIKQKGRGTPTEIVGASGNVVPNDFRPAADVPKAAPRPAVNAGNPALAAEPIALQASEQPSLMGRIGDAIIPRAEAAEPASGNPWDHDEVVQAALQAGGNPWDHDPVVAQPDGMALSALKGAGAGFGRTVLAGQELLGKGLDAVGATGPGDWLVNDARRGIGNLGQEIAPDQAAHPVATTVGDLAGGMVLPGGIAGKVGGNALRVAALGGGVSGLLTPSTGDGVDYWKNKAIEAASGATIGAATEKAGNALARMVTPKLQPMVQKLMGEGIQLTPGQMAGGAVKAAEDKAMSIPLTGDAIKAARRRSFDDFNRAAWNRVLEPLGQKMPGSVKMGRDAMNYVDDQLKDAYQRILPNLKLTSVQNDPTFVNDMTSAISDARSTLPDAQFKHFENIVRSQLLDKLGPRGTSVDGKLINGIDSMLGSEARGYKSDPTHDGRKLGESIEEVQAAYRNLLERQNPSQASALRAAREAWANYVRVGKAAASQGTAKTEGIFSPAQLNAAVRAENHTTRKLGYGKGAALLQDLSDAGMAVLPSDYPDSGTAGRAMMGAMLGSGAGYAMHNPLAPLAMLAGTAPYTAPVSRVTNWLMNRLAQTPSRNVLSDAVRWGGVTNPAIVNMAAAAGPTRNALAALARGGGQLAAPAVGSLVAGSIPSMVIRPGNGQ